MPQDAFTLKIAARELKILLLGGKINKITQPSDGEIVMQTYANGKNVSLMISANAQTARICPTAREFINPAVAPNFCMLLRKHLLGANVTSVDQRGYERIIEMTFSAKNDFRENVEKKLVCEIMGKYSNVILTENGKILGTLRPAFGEMDGARVLFTGSEYMLPPAQDKAEITEKTRVLGHFLSFEGGAADKFLSSVIKGVSIQTAREAAVRFFGTADLLCGFKEKSEEFYGYLLDFLENPQPHPNVCGNDFYALDYKSVCGEKKYFPDLLSSEQYFFDRADDARDRHRLYKALFDKIKAHEKKLAKKLQQVTDKEISCENMELNRKKGELLTAYQHTVRAGASSCELADYYSETGETIKIELDKDLSANRNAQNYFKKYAKQKKTLSVATEMKKEILTELDYVATLFSELDLCETPADFDALTEELKDAGLLRIQKNGRKKERPSMPLTFVLGDFYIKCGRNNVQNDALTFGAAKEDVWLHTKGFRSAHVIVETNGEKIKDEVLLAAAEICAYHSEARGGDKVPVDYCLKKYVKKPPKSKPGGVIYTDFKTVLVTPDPHTELLKK